jgi:hypothetical protein
LRKDSSGPARITNKPPSGAKSPTHSADLIGPAKQVAEKLNRTGFVTGHDFSRADKASKMNRALQAAEKLNPGAL